MTAPSVLQRPYLCVIGVQLLPFVKEKRAPPLQLCKPNTSDIGGALQPEHLRLVGIYTDNDWLIVQLPRDVGLLGLPLTGKHPCSTWYSAWDDQRVNLFVLNSGHDCWSEPIEDWDELFKK